MPSDTVVAAECPPSLKATTPSLLACHAIAPSATADTLARRSERRVPMSNIKNPYVIDLPFFLARASKVMTLSCYIPRLRQGYAGHGWVPDAQSLVHAFARDNLLSLGMTSGKKHRN